VVASTTAVFNIRYRAVTPKDRVVLDGKVYDIQSVNELGRKKELELICTSTDLYTDTDPRGGDDLILTDDMILG
jgi:hypothetical protein